jgi:hypothetical protein
MRSLQRIVDRGNAEWHVTPDGELHISLSSGERFLLGTRTLTRLA